MNLRDIKIRDVSGVGSIFGIDDLLIAAAVSGIGAAIGGSKQAKATTTASDAAAQAARENTALSREVYERNTANLNPFLQTGYAANDRISGALGLGGDADAAAKAYEGYKTSTGYQNQLQTGVDALTQNAITGGAGLRSGATLKRLTQYGQDLGAQSFQTYLGQLTGQQGVGLGAGSALAGVGTNMVNQVSAANDSAASTKANAALAGAANTNALLGTLGSAFGTYAGLSS